MIDAFENLKPDQAAVLALKVMQVRPKEAAKLLGTTEKTLADWRCRGTGPVYCKSGSAVVYPLSEIEKYINAQKKVEPRY